jgi:hypothetical protein
MPERDGLMYRAAVLPAGPAPTMMMSYFAGIFFTFYLNFPSSRVHPLKTRPRQHS